MINQISKLKWRVAHRIPLPVFRILLPRKVLGLYYHLISDEPLAHVRHLYTSKTIAMFESDLVYLKRDYQPISYEQFLEHTSDGKRLPSNALLLTFDDGFSQCFSVARPLLKKYGIPCIFFIPTDTLDNRSMLYRHKVSLCIEQLVNGQNYLWKEALARLNKELGTTIDRPEAFIRWIKTLDYCQKGTIDFVCELLEIDVDSYLREYRPYLTTEEVSILASEGFTIGAHTKTHPLLRLLSESEMQEEIVGSCRVIQGITRKAQVPFSFPFSARGLNRDALAGLRESHTEVGYLFDTMGVQQDREFIINRIEADRPYELIEGTNLPSLIRQAYQEVFVTK